MFSRETEYVKNWKPQTNSFTLRGTARKRGMCLCVRYNRDLCQRAKYIIERSVSDSLIILLYQIKYGVHLAIADELQ